MKLTVEPVSQTPRQSRDGGVVCHHPPQESSDARSKQIPEDEHGKQRHAHRGSRGPYGPAIHDTAQTSDQHSTPAQARRQYRVQEAEAKEAIEQYRRALKFGAGIMDMSDTALHWWAKHNITVTHIQQACVIAKRNGRPTAEYVAALVRNHISPKEPWQTLDRKAPVTDMGKLRGKTPHAGSKWTDAWDQVLRDLVNDRRTIPDIAKAMGRTNLAIQARIPRVFGGPVDGYPVYPEPVS